MRFIIVGQKLKDFSLFIDAIKKYKYEIIYSDTGYEHMLNNTSDTIFICDNFESSIFQKLHSFKCRIIGPAIIIYCTHEYKSIPLRTRPLFSLSMDNLIICFNGFKCRKTLAEIADIVHKLGGSIRKDVGLKVTHLVSNSTSGEKYRVGVSMGTHIMSEEWIHQCWHKKDDPFFRADQKNMMQYKLFPFSFAFLSFYGFSREETRHMEEVTVTNGGQVVETGAPMSTHLVVNERSIHNITCQIQHKLFVVKSEWFWASVQMEASADETMYLFELDSDATTPASQGEKRTPKTLSSGVSCRNQRRKRLRENLAHLSSEGELDGPNRKRQSADFTRQSNSASFLDVTAETSNLITSHLDVFQCEIVTQDKSPLKLNNVKEITKLSIRQQTIMELYQTEKNYIGILQTIIQIFKDELERIEQPGGPIIDALESKTIFGCIPPIYSLHIDIKDGLADIVLQSNEHKSVGEIYLAHIEEFMRHYPNFINYFERTKEAINMCDTNKPRFHAFLKLCQSKVECGRQTLTELLIRPVQRLPSVILLLKDILKRTDVSHTDYDQLQKAIIGLEEVMKHINEDKRKAEGHQIMFEIINDIEGCPPCLLSAHRNFLFKVDCIEVTDNINGRGSNVSLFIFSDSLEVCKKRFINALTSKSPGPSSHCKKPYKHLTLVQFSHIKRIVDICDAPEDQTIFALVTKRLDEEEKLLAFRLVDINEDQEDLLISISKAICTSQCRTDYETLLAAVESHELNINLSQLSTKKTFSKVATKFSRRVSRVFSLNKTPAQSMKRAISSVAQLMSPMRRDSSFLMHNMPIASHQISSNYSKENTPSISNSDPSNIIPFMNEADRYSEIVDKMSIGTPAMQKRRETLAGITHNDIRMGLEGLEYIKTSQKFQDSGTFLTPLPVKQKQSFFSRQNMTFNNTKLPQTSSISSINYDAISFTSQTSISNINFIEGKETS